MQNQFCYIPIDSLQAGRFQPRQDFNLSALQELANSIASQGLIEPLVVREIAKDRYEILAGERRWRASRLAGLTEIPCLIGDYTDKQACALTLIENIQRQDLNLIEEAQGYRRLIDEFHYQQDELSVLVGKSRSHIANILRLLTLSDNVKDRLRDRILSLGHARVLVGLPAMQQELFAERVINEGWSVRHLEQEIKSFKEQVVVKPANPKTDRDVERLQTILSEQVGAPVQIVNEGSAGGWLQVKFFDNDTLAGLLERFGLRYD